MNDEELRIHLERGLANLRREFAGKVPAEHVTRVGMDRFETLIESARITDFIPLLVYRETREELLAFEPGKSTWKPPRRIEVSARALESVHG